MNLTIYLKGGGNVTVPCTKDEYNELRVPLQHCFITPRSYTTGKPVTLDLVTRDGSFTARLLATEIAGWVHTEYPSCRETELNRVLDCMEDLIDTMQEDEDDEPWKDSL